MTNLALIGAGRMGSVHLEAIRDSTAVELIAVADPSPDALAAAGALVPHAALRHDADDAFAQAGVDGCVIAAPTHAHRGLVAAALRAGLHVLCEKPLTLNPDTSDDLGAQADAAGLVLQVGFWRRYCPALIEAKSLLAAGAIGRPLSARLVQWDVECPPTDWCAPEHSGGIFVDMGVHEFDQLEWLFEQPIVQLQSLALPLSEPGLVAVGDFDNVVVWARLAGELAASIELSRTARYADDVRLEILGADGALLVDTQPAGRVRLGGRDGLKIAWAGEPGQMQAGVTAELEAFAAAIAGHGDADRPDAAASVRATRLAQLARESASRGEPVHLPAR